MPELKSKVPKLLLITTELTFYTTKLLLKMANLKSGMSIKNCGNPKDMLNSTKRMSFIKKQEKQEKLGRNGITLTILTLMVPKRLVLNKKTLMVPIRFVLNLMRSVITLMVPIGFVLNLMVPLSVTTLMVPIRFVLNLMVPKRFKLVTKQISGEESPRFTPCGKDTASNFKAQPSRTKLSTKPLPPVLPNTKPSSRKEVAPVPSSSMNQWVTVSPFPSGLEMFDIPSHLSIKVQVDDHTTETSSNTDITGVTAVSVSALIAGASYLAMKKTDGFNSDIHSSLIDQE